MSVTDEGTHKTGSAGPANALTWAGFTKASRWLAEGIAGCRDLNMHLKKRAEINEEYARAMLKLHAAGSSLDLAGDATLSPLSSTMSDGKLGGSVGRLWVELEASAGAQAQAHLALAVGIKEKICGPAKALIKEMEDRLKQYNVEYAKAESELSASLAALTKARNHFHRTHKEAEAARASLEGAMKDTPDSSRTQKRDRRASRAISDSQSQEVDYLRQLKESNAVFANVYKNVFPALSANLENLEIARIQFMRNQAHKFAQLMAEVPTSLTERVSSLQTAIKNVSAQNDVASFTSKKGTFQWTTFEFEPAPILFDVDAAPHHEEAQPPPAQAQAQTQQTERPTDKARKKILPNPSKFFSLRNPSSSSLPINKPPATGAQPSPTSPAAAPPVVPMKQFGTAPQKIMETQQRAYPELELPYMLIILGEHMLVNRAFECEGIFRVQASAPEVRAVQQELDTGKFTALESVTNVHLLASLMKKFLREMPDPLIPDSLYDRCIATRQATEAYDILEQVPSLNRKIIMFLLQFLQIFIDPEKVEKSRMNADNLAMVFAPSFVRCPSTDLGLVISLVHKEKDFVRLLIENYQTYGTPSTPSTPTTPTTRLLDSALSKVSSANMLATPEASPAQHRKSMGLPSSPSSSLSPASASPSSSTPLGRMHSNVPFSYLPASTSLSKPLRPGTQPPPRPPRSPSSYKKFDSADIPVGDAPSSPSKDLSVHIPAQEGPDATVVADPFRETLKNLMVRRAGEKEMIWVREDLVRRMAGDEAQHPQADNHLQRTASGITALMQLDLESQLPSITPTLDTVLENTPVSRDEVTAGLDALLSIPSPSFLVDAPSPPLNLPNTPQSLLRAPSKPPPRPPRNSLVPLAQSSLSEFANSSPTLAPQPGLSVLPPVPVPISPTPFQSSPMTLTLPQLGDPSTSLPLGQPVVPGVPTAPPTPSLAALERDYRKLKDDLLKEIVFIVQQINYTHNYSYTIEISKEVRDIKRALDQCLYRLSVEQPQMRGLLTVSGPQDRPTLPRIAVASPPSSRDSALFETLGSTNIGSYSAGLVSALNEGIGPGIIIKDMTGTPVDNEELYTRLGKLRDVLGISIDKIVDQIYILESIVIGSVNKSRFPPGQETILLLTGEQKARVSRKISGGIALGLGEQALQIIDQMIRALNDIIVTQKDDVGRNKKEAAILSHAIAVKGVSLKERWQTLDVAQCVQDAKSIVGTKKDLEHFFSVMNIPFAPVPTYTPKAAGENEGDKLQSVRDALFESVDSMQARVATLVGSLEGANPERGGAVLEKLMQVYRALKALLA
eukprot:TRINITY_DN2021_c0_g1_i5.p1 TRINITY_DN2021_c0_g1~~TRINITY_DN2021_c0_g1_i5.p1  ORF type:complete len:1300 (+),score=397.66 TRINITY_DN2021_c0_g1_i5:103-4002(+)